MARGRLPDRDMVQESGRNGTKQFQGELASADVDISAGLGKMNPDGDNNRGSGMDLLAMRTGRRFVRLELR